MKISQKNGRIVQTEKACHRSLTAVAKYIRHACPALYYISYDPVPKSKFVRDLRDVLAFNGDRVFLDRSVERLAQAFPII